MLAIIAGGSDRRTVRKQVCIDMFARIPRIRVFIYLAHVANFAILTVCAECHPYLSCSPFMLLGIAFFVANEWVLGNFTILNMSRNPDGHNPKYWNKHPEALQKLHSATSPEVPALTMAGKTSKPLPLFDSINIGLALLGIFLLILPQFAARVAGLVVLCIAGFWYIGTSYWTHAWKKSWQVISALLFVGIVGGSIGPQLIAQWGREHPQLVQLKAVISGMIPQSGNAAGCTIYQIQTFPVSVHLDKLEMKLQFPHDVYTFKVGMASEYPGKGGVQMAPFEIGLAGDGECYIRQTGFIEDASVRATKWGPGTVRILGTDIPAGSSITGAFIPYRNQRSFPPTDLQVEGTYDYQVAGVPHSGEIKIIDQGVVNAK